MRKVAVFLLFATLALPLTALRRSAARGFFASQAFDDVYYVPPATFLRPMSLGYTEALADLLFIRGLLYYGEGFVYRRALRHVADYADAIVSLDPDFRAAYHWATVAVAYQSRAAPVEDLERVAILIEQAADRFPEDGQVQWWAGSFLVYEYAPRFPAGSPGRQRANERGAPRLARAAMLGAGPRWLALSSASHLARMGQRTNAIEHLRTMLALTTEPNVRRTIQVRLGQLESAEEAETLGRSADAAEAARLRDFPYLDAALYELVGPRRVAPASLPEQP